MFRTFSQKLDELFGIDLRALAVFRIGLALTILLDLFIRCRDVIPFYTDAGVLPRAALLSRLSPPSALCLHLANGTAGAQAILFFLQALCAIGLLIGFRTSWATFFSWLFMISLHRRNPLILGGGDTYLRMLLFWSLFTPLGSYFSIDSARDPSPSPRPSRVLSAGSAALLIQSALVYFLAGAYKWGGAHWQDGSAIYYTLNIDPYARSLSHWLLLLPTLLHVLTHAVLWFELIGPWLLFCPVKTRLVRPLMVGGFVAMQMAFSSILYLQTFPLVGILAMTVFLPSSLWDRVMSPPQTPGWIRKDSWPTRMAVGLLLGMVILRALSLWQPSRIKLPIFLNGVVQSLHVEQTWNLFGPTPLGTSGWFIVPGKLRSGRDIDLFRAGAPLTWAKPPSILATFHNERWRKYMMLFNLGKQKPLWPLYGHYLCQQWNSCHQGPERLTSLQVVFMARNTPPDYTVGIYQKRILLKYSCGANTLGRRHD